MPLFQTYLELYPEGESTRHIRCVESLGFSYGHRRKDIIEPLSKTNLHRGLVHHLNGQLDIVEEAV